LKSELPAIDRAEFERRLGASTASLLEVQALDRLFLHYSELRKWNRRLSLVGPGTSRLPVQRHYKESLQALELIDPLDRVVVDHGSGAGFPGWVLAAARPELEVTLVEANGKKWSFLELVSHKAALPCRCLNARVSTVIPEGFPSQVDLILVRAVRLSEREVAAMITRMTARGRFLVWAGEEVPLAMEGLSVDREVPIEGSDRRRILEIVRSN
jgi:16S rRNA (guanine(527)-N(7))-methyltransferase RsmG